MKIALVIPRFDPHLGGAERWTWDFAARLLRHGHEVHVVAERFAAEIPDGLADARRHVVATVFGGPSRRRFGFAAGAEQLLKALHLDVVHDMGQGWYGNVFMPHGGTRGGSFRQNLLLCPAGLRWAKEAAAGLLPRYRTFRQLERRQYVADGSRLFVALSEMVRRDMCSFHSLPAELVRLVYNGIDTERFSPARRVVHRDRMRHELGVQREVIFLIVAHNFKLKGVGPAIEATARLARDRRDIRLVIVGNDRAAPYQRLARQLGCAELVQFVGPASDSVPFYSAADVYLHPTYYDPCSLVVLEALAIGLPVITSVHNGAGELLTPGDEGFLLEDPADVPAMVASMRKLMVGEFREDCGRRARGLAQRHDLERNYRELLAVYEEASCRAPLAVQRAAA